ncbi:MAG: type secretion system protein [Verrucomicrobiales bacterium]|nr:type secretion system protein [Verrucomicrobiales bacterium]
MLLVVNSKKKRRKTNGFTLIEIMVVVGIIGLLAAIAMPSFLRPRARAQTNACINNIRQIEAAMQQWALENNKATNSHVTHSQLLVYVKTPPICPAAGTTATFDSCYTFDTVSDTPVCTTDPANHVLQ